MGLLSTIGSASGRAFGLTRVGAAIKDAYFNLTTLLLNTSSTNGAQNNTFLDSSSNNFTITRNGNTTQGTFSPFSQTGWSNYFTSGNYIYTTSNTAIVLSTGSWTIEAWAFCTGGSGYRSVLSKRTGATSEYEMGIDTSGNFYFYVGTTVYATTTAVPLNAWTNLTITYDGTNLRMFQDGVLTKTQASVTAGSGTGNLAISVEAGSATQSFPGYISNVRITKGGALYTSAFTPSTTPLTTTVSSGTVSFLTCQSNRFVDSSASPLSITVTGTPSVQAFSPFAPTAAYSTTTVGGSGYFDGSGDSLASTTDFESSTSISTFTIEGWVYPTTFSTLINVIGGMVVSSGDQKSIAAEVNTSGQVALYWFDGAIKRCTGNTAMRLNAWNYFAIVVTSNAIAIYVNKTTADTLSGTTTLTTRTQLTDLGVGAYYNNNAPAQYFNGYLASVRYSTVARTISSIPTAPLSSDSDVRWLINFTNAGIFDAAAKNDLETVGNAQVSTTQAKFGTTSMYFDGTGDYLDDPAILNAQFGTGDFTIEGWIYINSLAAAQAIFEFRTAATATYGQIYITTGGVLRFYLPTDIGTSNTFSTTTWTHFAITRASGTLNMYINGTRGYTNTYTSAMDAAKIRIGAAADGTSGLNAYLDDIRITKGYARYTGSTLTVPTAAFPVQ